MTDRTPVTVIGGYLGAGKTTVLNELLRQADARRIAVLVNDFGEIPIDLDLIERRRPGADDDVEVLELANGCVCCTLAGEFAVSMDRLRNLEPPAELVLIELSGVGEPASVAAWARTPGFRLDGIVVVVDVERVRSLASDRYVGDTVHRQLRAADLVVLTKVDLATDAEHAAVREWLAGITDAPVIEATRGRVPIEALVGRDPVPSGADGSSTESGAPPGRHRDLVTVSRTWPGTLDEVAMRRVLADLPVGVLRAKGIVRVTGSGWTVVQMVGRRVELSPLDERSDEPSRLVVIARPDVDRGEIEGILDRAVGSG